MSKSLDIQTLIFLESEWIKLDDLIKWLKLQYQETPSEDIHSVLKTIICLKNSEGKEVKIKK